MSGYKRSEIVSGVFVALAAGLLTWFAFRAGGFASFALVGPRPVTCVTEFNDVQGLDVGARVFASGRVVGEVRQLRLIEAEVSEADRARIIERTGDPASAAPVGSFRAAVQVRFTLRDRALRLDPTSARVRVAQDGLLGETILLLEPGHWAQSQPPLASQGLSQPVRLRAEEPAGINEAIAELSPAIRRVSSVLRKVDEQLATTENFAALSESVQDFRLAIASVRAFVDEKNGALYERIVKPVETLLNDTDGAVKEIQRRVVDETLAEANAFLRDGRALVADSRDAVAAAQSAITDASPRVNQLLDDADAASRTLEARVDDVSSAAQSLLGLTQETIAQGQPDLLESLRRLRRTMWEAEMAMRKIRANPAYLLFGDTSRLLDAPPLDATGLRSTGRARPFEQRDENDGGR